MARRREDAEAVEVRTTARANAVEILDRTCKGGCEIEITGPCERRKPRAAEEAGATFESKPTCRNRQASASASTSSSPSKNFPSPMLGLVQAVGGAPLEASLYARGPCCQLHRLDAARARSRAEAASRARRDSGSYSEHPLRSRTKGRIWAGSAIEPSEPRRPSARVPMIGRDGLQLRPASSWFLGCRKTLSPPRRRGRDKHRRSSRAGLVTSIVDRVGERARRSRCR